jgi:hypothetical protein
MKPIYSQIKLKYILNYLYFIRVMGIILFKGLVVCDGFSTISTYLRQLKRISNHFNINLKLIEIG